jgi:hypothetical protein
MGPRLPGRIPLKFTWAFDGQNSLNTYVGGDFRPVVWPSSSTKRLSYTVLVNGEAWSFPVKYTVTYFDVPDITARGDSSHSDLSTMRTNRA